VNFRPERQDFVLVSQATRLLEVQGITALTVGLDPSFSPRVPAGIIILVHAHQKKNGFKTCYDLDMTLEMPQPA
jgi:hypothetical protein